MKILQSVDRDSLGVLTSLDNVKNAIFLAGPCPRKDFKDDWRQEAIDILKKYCFDGIVLNPTNPHFDTVDLTKQTEWEYEAMKKASAIIFWIPRTKEHPAFTTNLELGQWWGKKGVFVGYPKDSIKNEYIGVRMKMMGQKVYDNLEDLCYAAIQDLNPKTPRSWFTSDTHFGQERTLELSRRPFKTVEDMDLELISNWNKSVRPCDTVYHLGDFGENMDNLALLNYDKLNFILGNYEKKDLQKYRAELKKYKGITIYDNDECTYKDKDYEYILRHEPINPDEETKDSAKNTYLFGHIHGKDCYKRNGLEVGTDAYNYTPINDEEVNWRMNAIKKYVDENVFIDIC